MTIYGKNPVQEALNSGKNIARAFVLENTNRDLCVLFRKKNIPVTILNRKRFDELFAGTNQGIAVEVEDYKFLTLEQFLEKTNLEDNPVVLMLDGIQDPHNLGAIIRSAEAGGVKAVILPKKRAATITATVVKASAGAIEYMDIVETVNLVRTAEQLKESGFWIVGTAVEGENDYTEIFIDRPLCLVIGSEGKGMHKLLREHSDMLVKIPMAGKINSLNASVGAAIVIFDILRRKKG